MPRSSSHPSSNQPDRSSTSESAEAHAVGTFLRNLADRAETNSDLAREIQTALTESGLLTSSDQRRQERAVKARQDKRDQAEGIQASFPAVEDRGFLAPEPVVRGAEVIGPPDGVIDALDDRIAVHG